jgi:uroporphyrinogen decarboxylase
MSLPVASPQSTQPVSQQQPLLVKAFGSQPLSRPPVWFMRQAGRYMPEYRAIREKVSFLELCKSVDLATEVSLQPYKAFGTDAVIMFCDILIPPEAMGMELDFTDKGPKFAKPLQHASDVDALIVPDPNETMGYVMALLSQLRRELTDNPDAALIGFAGSPWTLATYMIEGGTSKNFRNIKGWMYHQPEALHKLLGKLADTVALYLNAQIEAGAQMVQLFDTWGGLLDEAGYCEFVRPYMERVLRQVPGLKEGSVPRVYYINTAAHLTDALFDFADGLPFDGLSVDHRVPLPALRKRAAEFGHHNLLFQGNLDPIAMLAPQQALKPLVHNLLDENTNQPYIFNVGHGLIPQTPTDNVAQAVKWVQAYTS